MTLDNLGIGYSHTLVSGISQRLTPGQFVCLTGRNGTGKSTLLRTLCGLLPPLQGSVSIGGQQLHTLPSSLLARKIGLVLTQAPELHNTTLRELVAYGRLPYTTWTGRLSAEDLDAADEAIRTLGIEHLAHRPLLQLSDGERQKGMIARALAQGTEYMLLDEPSAFLDHESKQELMQLLVHLAHDGHKAILLSTHDLELAERYADLLWHISDGHLSAIRPTGHI